ncbi:ATP-binding protein [Streptomyces sp. NRRL B-24484]|uniref:ATP-binding protein n=1 Tax=Streptomyces sp. NRRL B-24484 TaxID=1463833 RepID=UPI000694BBD2|nr:ATP-binding protein [Streptomyces sp. NRRL B-24484]
MSNSISSRAVALAPGPDVPVRSARLRASVTLSAVPESVPRLRGTARALVRSRRLPADVAEALSVIVTELVTNAVLHSGSADVSVLFEVCESALTVRVRDWGRWRERTSPRREPADVDAAFGRGLDLVNAFAVDTTVVRSADGTLVEAVIAL